MNECSVVIVFVFVVVVVVDVIVPLDYRLKLRATPRIRLPDFASAW